MIFVMRSVFCLILICTLVSPAAANTFFTDSHLEWTVRATGEEAKTKGKDTPETSRIQSAGIGRLYYKSGMFKNFFGVEGVAYHVIPFRYDEKNASNRYGKDETFFQEGKNGFGKLGIALRIEPNENLRFKYGRMESNHVLLGPGEFRTTPRMYEMATARVAWQPVVLSMMHVTGASDYSDDGFRTFSTYKSNWENGELEKQPLQILDLTMEKGPFGFKAAYGRQKNIQNYAFVEASLKQPLNEAWAIGAAGGFRHKDDEREASKSKDHTLGMWGGEVTISRHQTWVKIAFSNVEKNPEMFGTMGTEWVLDGTLFNGCKNNGYYTTGVQGVFNHDGEKASKIEIGQDFETGILKGVSLSAYYIEGKNIHHGDEFTNNLRQHEVGGRIAYAVPTVPGLFVELKHGRNTMRSDGPYGMDQKMETTLLNLSYAMKLL